MILFVVVASNTKYEFRIIAETSIGHFVNGSSTVHCTTSLQENSEKGKGSLLFHFYCQARVLLSFWNHCSLLTMLIDLIVSSVSDDLENI